MTVAPLCVTRHWPFTAPAISGLRQPVLVIGNFDGVHRGHLAVVAKARQLAESLERSLVALTFEPHPRDVFNPARPVFRLTPLAEKARLLALAGCDATLAINFDAALSGLEAQDFVRELLIGACEASGVVVGHDFHFGKGRAGTPDLLRDWLEQAGINCIIVPPQLHGGTDGRQVVGEGDLFSSRAIRAALEEGDIAAANAALGHEWSVTAMVEHGDKRGRQLGFPTANLHLPASCRLAHGIYAVRASVQGSVQGRAHDAIASFGRRPTFDDGRPKLEVMLFGFDGDIYGRDLRVDFVAWIRGEERFGSIDALVAQMERDCAAARLLLNPVARRG